MNGYFPTQKLSRRVTCGGAVLLALAGTLGTAPSNAAQTNTNSGRPSVKSVEIGSKRYILRAQPGQAGKLADAVTKSGGVVSTQLNSVDVVTAYLASSQLGSVTKSSAYVSSAEDRASKPLQLASVASATSETTLQQVNAAINAPAMWAKGYTGKGVCVALIDTGVAPVAGLDDGRVVKGIDLSFDVSEDPTSEGLDAYGHGTHMASIIGGRDQGANLYSPTAFVGVAPETCVLNIKAGSFDGATDVSQIIAGIDWAVTNRAQYNIKVLNLSYGTASTQDYKQDPLDWAAEVAWRQGIVVVAAAGNDGRSARLTAPAHNPNILAVGAADPATDTPALFSNGSGKRLADLSAPGARIRALRVPGSIIDQNVAATTVGDRYIRGSGTSQATAVVSGAVALLAQQFPLATPDQIKDALRATAQKLAAKGGGKGLLDVAGASDELGFVDAKAKEKVTGALAKLTAAKAAQASLTASADAKAKLKAATDVSDAQTALDKANTDFTTAQLAAATSRANDLAKEAQTRGRGSLESSRGGSHVSVDGKDNPVQGEVDAQGDAFVPATWAQISAQGRSWVGRSWVGRSWVGRSWVGRSWVGRSWVGRSWVGRSWVGQNWSDAVWTSN